MLKKKRNKLPRLRVCLYNNGRLVKRGYKVDALMVIENKTPKTVVK